MCQLLSHGWHARGEIREKLSAKALRRTQGFGKYEELCHLVDGKLSFCSSSLQIRDENFSPGIFLPSYFTTSHICPKLGKKVSPSRRYFMHLKEMLKLFHLSYDKNVKKVPWLTRSWMEPEQAPTSYKYLFFNHIRFGMKNWKLSLGDFLHNFAVVHSRLPRRKNFIFILGNISDTTVKFTIIEIRFSPKFFLLLLCQAPIVCSSRIESESQLAYAAA